MHSVTDRRTDGQQAYANYSRSYCVAVRSAKNMSHNGKNRADKGHHAGISRIFEEAKL